MSEPGHTSRITGWVFIVLGGLWILTVGGCSSLFLVSAFERPSEALLVLTIGAIFLLPGLVSLCAGIWLVKRRRPRAKDAALEDKP